MCNKKLSCLYDNLQKQSTLTIDEMVEVSNCLENTLNVLRENDINLKSYELLSKVLLQLLNNAEITNIPED